MSLYKLHILGCGSAKPSAHHLPSCQVLEFRNNLMMIDCGEGCQGQFMKMHLKFSRLKHIFISHLHGDHCFGLPGLLSTMSLHGHGGELIVHVFEEGAQIFSKMLNVFCAESSFDIKFNIIENKKSVILDDHSMRVTAIPLNHRVPAVGFLFEETPKLRHINAWAMEKYGVPVSMVNKLRAGDDYQTETGVIIPNETLTYPPTPSVSYAYISDTRPCGSIARDIDGVDWLYHEATYDDSLKELAKKRYHSTATDAAKCAERAHARHLILGHYSSRYAGNERILLDEAKAAFPNTILAQEGLTVELDAK